MANYVKPTQRDKQFQWDDFLDQPLQTTVAFDPFGITQMLGVQGTIFDPVESLKLFGLDDAGAFGFADGGAVPSDPMGNPFQMQSMMQRLGDAELAQVAQKPPVPGAQLMAIMELDKRKQMRMAGKSRPPGTTVLEDRVAESMPVQQSTMASDPIRSGLGAIMQQQRQPRAQPPRPMANGGGVKYYDEGGAVGEYMSDLEAIAPLLAQSYAGPSTPEEAMAFAAQFQGPDRLAPYEAQLSGREGDLTEDRRRDRWLALARAGLGMMGPGSFWGNVGRGGMAGLDALQGANTAYNSGRDRLMNSQIGLATARQGRDDRVGANALSTIQNRNNTLFNSGLAAAANVGRTRESQRDREAANWRDTNDIEVLAEQLYRANEGQMVQDGTSVSPMGQDIPFSRPYSREDAMRDAIALASTGRRGGASPDDLNERMRAAIAILDPMTGSRDPAVRQRAQEVLDGILSGEIGNAGTSTRPGSRAAPERAAAFERSSTDRGSDTDQARIQAEYDRGSFERGRARHQREQPGAVVGSQGGEPVADAYSAAERERLNNRR